MKLWGKLSLWGSLVAMLGLTLLFLSRGPGQKAVVRVQNPPNAVVQEALESPSSTNMATQNPTAGKLALSPDQLKSEIRKMLGTINPEILSRIDGGADTILVLINTLNVPLLLQLSTHSSFTNYLTLSGTGARFQGVDRGGTMQVGYYLSDLNQAGLLDGYVLYVRPGLRSTENVERSVSPGATAEVVEVGRSR